ncbi:MAG: hypothetical protein HDR71_15955 [Lachnospiraceae bacterium]|nr:hypothetical protein [Lachnospiraceae bacterium]
MKKNNCYNAAGLVFSKRGDRTMHTIKKYKCLKIVLPVLLIIFLLFIYILISHHSDKDSFGINDVYGNWKVTRVIYQAKGGYGELPLGNEIGRSFSISEDKIKDSKSYDTAVLEKQVCYDIDVLQYEEKKYDVSGWETLVDFQFNNNIVLDKAGIADTIISEYTFYAYKGGAKEEDPFYAPAMTVFPYKESNKDILVKKFNYGSYILERYKNQIKTGNLQGKWLVEGLISRGRGEKEGIDFIENYGKVYQFADDILKCADSEYKVSYQKEAVDREDYENINGISEGLGIENKEIYIFHVKLPDDRVIEVIPINDNEIIAQIGEQWFCLKRIKDYVEPAVYDESILNGEWKPTLLMAIGDVDPEMEANNYSSPLYWYGNSVMLDADAYVVSVSEWKTDSIQAKDFKEKYNVPQNVIETFNDTDMLHIASRKVGQAEEIYIILDHSTMLRGRNGLWFRLEKIE